MRLTEYHAKFPGGIRWRITLEGVELEGQGLLRHNTSMHERGLAMLGQYAAEFADVSREFAVPVELPIACALTQSAIGPERYVRRDPGYVSDDATPDLISAGVCRMPLWMARFFLKDSKIDHNWLLIPRNALRACAAYIRFNRATLRTGWDPVLVACAFNACGLYEDKSPGNRWRLRQYSALFYSTPGARVVSTTYADGFSQYFCAARQLVDDGLLNDRDFIAYRSLIAPSNG